MTNARKERIEHCVHRGTLIIDLKKIHRVISSAPMGGGIRKARSIINHQVPANPAVLKRPVVRRWDDPARYLGRLGKSMKASMPMVGLMTAVPMKQLVIDREQRGPLWVQCFCTVGVTNAVRAGEPILSRRRTDRTDTAGTINIILVTNATLTTTALVGAVQVATESKTGTLIKKKVPSTFHASSLATGTGTDAVVIASSLEGRYRMLYSGTHTEIGAMIGRLVTRCVEKGLTRSTQWCEIRSRRVDRSRKSS